LPKSIYGQNYVARIQGSYQRDRHCKRHGHIVGAVLTPHDQLPANRRRFVHRGGRIPESGWRQMFLLLSSWREDGCKHLPERFEVRKLFCYLIASWSLQTVILNRRRRDIPFGGGQRKTKIWTGTFSKPVFRLMIPTAKIYKLYRAIFRKKQRRGTRTESVH
jgi:hypothetical protein